MLSVSSCDSDNGFDYMGFEHRYHYEDEDTVVSASEHEFVLSMITDKPGDYIPDDWKIGTIDYLITDKSDPLYGDNRRVSRNNLKNIMCLNSGKNWNDRISSYSFNMGIFNTHLKDY